MQTVKELFLKYREAIGAGLIVLLALISIADAIRFFYHARESYWSRLGIEYFEHRYTRLINNVPPSGLFGYVCDHDDPVAASVEFLLSKYHLAPRLLKKSDEPELIIGNFRNFPLDNKALTDRGLIVLQDFGEGVLLLGRRE
jgi:hypothetical protein